MPPLFGHLLAGRLGMPPAVVAELAHPDFVDRLIWPSPFGTRLANIGGGITYPQLIH